MAAPPVSQLSGVRRAILAPWADVVCAGAASIGLFVVWAVLGLDLTSPQTLQRVAGINFLINAPHFMASYKLLYGSQEKRRQYPGVTFWIPLALMLWSLVGLVSYREHRIVLEVLFRVSAVSLSWHYTGQAWGMMASFAHLHGLSFTPRERRLLRGNLWTLMTFHIVWAVTAQGTPLYRGMAVAAVLSMLAGLAGLLLFVRRTRREPPARVWIPWIAVHSWYVLLYCDPAAIFWVQNAHALQYLIFPMRVELNRREFGAAWDAADAGAAPPVALPSRGRLAWGMARWYALVTVAGLVVLGGLPWLADTQSARAGLAGLPIELTLVSFVNLHHYLIDGVIWKIRNPVVRRDLFAHLAPG